MSNLEIRPVTNRRQWNDFFEVRRRIYQDDPAAVMPLRSMEWTQLDPKRHPFYEHATRQVFICYENGLPIGRIAAIKDDLHNEHYNDRVGFFGFFESPNRTDVAQLLLDTARNWLVEQGCQVMRGPVNPSMKGEFGVLTKGFDIMPFVMMGHSTDYYDQLLQDVGLNVAKQFFAYRFDSHTFEDLEDRWEKLDEFEAKVLKRFPQLSLRTVNASNFDKTMQDVNELGNKVRAENYGFVPLTAAELKFMISQLRRIIRYDMIYVAYWEDKLVGFIVNVPDLNWALKRTRGRADWIRMPQLLYLLKKTRRTRVIALGVDEDYRKKGIAILLINRLIKMYHHYDVWEFSWVVEDNVKSIRAIDRTMTLSHHKTYRIYEQPIGS